MRIAVKVLLLAVLAFAVQGALERLHVAPTETPPPELAELDATIASRPEVLLLGDSVTRYVAKGDADRRPLWRMLADALPEQRVTKLYHLAYEAGVFEAFFRYLDERAPEAMVTIVPINMRSFSPIWDYRPQYQFEREKLLLWTARPPLPLLRRPLLVFKAVDLVPIDKQQFLAQPVFEGTRRVGTVRDFYNPSFRPPVTDDKVRKKLILSYLQPLGLRHRKLRSLVSIARMAKGSGRKVVFYVTPVDVDTGTAFLGDEFRNIVAGNVDLAVATLRGEGATVVDLAFTLPAGDFDWKGETYPNEHLAASGRRKLAAALADAVRDTLGIDSAAGDAQPSHAGPR